MKGKTQFTFFDETGKASRNAYERTTGVPHPGMEAANDHSLICLKELEVFTRPNG
jgi:hypothetical protein